MKRIAVAVGVLVVALVAAVAVRATVAGDETPVVVVHWSNSHPARDELLPAMVEEFNEDDHETADGRPIEIVLVSCDSATQVHDLSSRIAGTGTGAVDGGCAVDGGPAGDPTIITPQSSDWLVDLNHEAGRQVVDVDSPHLAETWLGIVTYRDMAECLGWPDEDLGYHTILDLAADPEGWGAHECAELEWGREPLLAFTNPNTSTSGRNVLVSLYSMAAGRSPAELTVEDVTRPDVVQFVKDFQGVVDHYQPGTIPLIGKIVQGRAYGHFFLMPEDNLVSLAEGREKALVDGVEQVVPPVRDLVMIYPSEGSVLNANPAAIVDAPWVGSDTAEAASEWIDFVREDAQQQRFVDAGFRPGTDDGPAVDARQFAEWGLDPAEPENQIEPGDLAPDVLAKIIGSWGAVKNPAIVTFVVDVSGSMAGEPLAQVKDGLLRVLDAMRDGGGDDDQVGLVPFSDTVVEPIVPPAPVKGAAFHIADGVLAMEATGQTSLYDALGRAVELTSAAEGADRARRFVVVLSDGAATAGRCLDELVVMRARNEAPIVEFCGRVGDVATDSGDRRVAIEDIRGESLRVGSDDVQVFFLGFGEADIDVGRILAEATGAEYQGSTDEDLAGFIEKLGGYF